MWSSIQSLKDQIVGRFHATTPELREQFDENGNNGLLIQGKYLPEELLLEILRYVDCDTLRDCQLVCKRWRDLIRDYVWRKKAEAVVGQPLPLVNYIPWSVYHAICKKRPFGRNLLKNHSGRRGLTKDWTILSQGGDRWTIECPPVSVPPLPVEVDPVFEGEQCCFATSYYECSMEQSVDLAAEGLSSQLMDRFRPPIEVSEWYSCRSDCPAMYKCSVKLLDGSGKLVDSFQFIDSLEDEKQNVWLRFLHVFKNYGAGVRRVSFYHAGKDKSFWAGHYGSKMAGACVRVKLPEAEKSAGHSKSMDDLDVD